jgi:hypothetical protein
MVASAKQARHRRNALGAGMVQASGFNKRIAWDKIPFAPRWPFRNLNM